MANKTETPDYLSPAPCGGLYWGPLVEGRLIKRYKRFLADVELADGTVVTAHTPNTGRMIGCSEPGRPVWLSLHESPTRKYPYTWELIEMPYSLVGLNTMVPNKLVARAAALGFIAETDGPTEVETEVSCGQSRLDLRLTGKWGQVIMVEVKNCTLAEDGVAMFPDAVTARGSKHIDELVAQVQKGHRAAVMVLVQRADANIFKPADHIDPEWGRRLRLAMYEGVELWVYQADISLTSISLGRPLPVYL